MPTSASFVAREALRQLASQKLPPTPDNYTRAYYEIATPGTKLARLAPTALLRELVDIITRRHPAAGPEIAALERAIAIADWDAIKTALSQVLGADSDEARYGVMWCQLVTDLFRKWEAHTPGLTRARKREALEHVLGAFSGNSELLYTRLRGLVGSWSEASRNGGATGVAEERPVASQPEMPDDKIAAQLREHLATTLTVAIVDRLGYPFELARDARELADSTRAVRTLDAATDLGAKLKKLWIALELRGDDQREIQQGLLRLLNGLCGSVGELVGDDSWMRDRLETMASLTAGSIDRTSLADLERQLREIVFKQGTLKRSLDQAKDALKDMVTTFIDRLGAMADNAGGYHDRMADYATRIERADNLPELSELISSVMRDTRSAQANIQRSRDDLMAARQQVDEYQSRVAALQRELIAVSDRLHEDPLTDLPNRRGLARAYESEASRADRRDEPLCLSIIDIDDFKRVNDTLGHQAGDLALVHLAGVVRRSIRPSDIVTRYGGEEFVILLPDTLTDVAVEVMARVQRELAQQAFLHNGEPVSIAFSAGVAQRAAGELQDDLISRADKALYRAKQTGKNRIIAA